MTVDPPLTPPAHEAAAKSGLHLPSYLLGLVTALILLGSALFLLRRPDPPAVELQPPPTPAAPTSTALPAEPTHLPIVVFVSGAVRQPGLYTLPPNSRIGDAIAASGGLLEGIDPANVNQAQPLSDGAQLHIPPGSPPATQSDPLSAEPLSLQPLSASTPAAGLTAALPSPTASVRSAPADPAVAPQTAGSASALPLINVNTATAAELESLPGIGPAKAQGIIDNRPYGTLEELDRVPGIGPSTLEQLLPLVTAG
jgi:competence protein ComEA